MNAYELADDLDGWSDAWLSDANVEDVFKEHANTLRQQANRIEVLEATHKQDKNIIKEQHQYIKELEMKVINLAFEVEYNKLTKENYGKENQS